jgi:cell division transport system permease protein
MRAGAASPTTQSKITESQQQRCDLSAVWKELSRPGANSRLSKSIERIRESLRNIRQTPLTFLIAGIVIAAVSCFLALLLVFLANIGSLLIGNTGEIQMSFFVVSDTPQQVLDSLMRDLQLQQGVIKVSYLSKEAALQKFVESLGEFEGIAEGLHEQNPLPSSIEVVIRSDILKPEELQEFADRYDVLPEVESVHYNKEWWRTLSTHLQLLGQIGILVTSSSFILALFIVANMMKLALYAHREELETFHLLGAQFHWITIPYLIEGALIGLGGVGGGLLLSWVLFQSVLPFVEIILGLEVLSFSYLQISHVMLVVLLGISVSLLGTYTALVHIASGWRQRSRQSSSLGKKGKVKERVVSTRGSSSLRLKRRR